MNEAHFTKIEKVLLYVSESRRFAEKVAGEIAKDGAEPHLVEALERAERQLAELHHRMMKETYFAVPEAPDDQEKLAV